MRNVIVTGIARADLAVVDQLAELGVATVHEATGRAGYLGPGLRPIQDGGPPEELQMIAPNSLAPDSQPDSEPEADSVAA